MSRQPSSLRQLVLACLLPLLAAPAAEAGVLFLRDGTAVRTQGGWTLRDDLVVFRMTNGQLASVRRSDVDARATNAARRPRAAPPAPAAPAATQPPARPAIVLTDADFRRPDDDSGTAAAAAPAGVEATPAPAAPAAAPPAAEHRTAVGERLVVSKWQRLAGVGETGVVITGLLPNRSLAVADDIRLDVLLYDEEGELVASTPALLTSSVLAPGQSARFRAEFPGVDRFSRVWFEVESRLDGAAGQQGP